MNVNNHSQAFARRSVATRAARQIGGETIPFPARSLRCIGALGLLLAGSLSGLAADLSTLCADREAVERVYYEHRLGTKPPFAEVLPPTSLEELVRLEFVVPLAGHGDDRYR